MTPPRSPGRPPHPDVLTPGEWRIVEAVRHGMGNAEIARRRGISPDAVKFHLANALGKLGFAGRAELRLWDGVRADSHLSKGRTAMPDGIQLGAIGQIARTVKNIDEARQWWGEVLGLPFLYAFGNLAFFDCGGVRLFLSEGEGSGAAESILYFRVGDIHAGQAALAERGVAFTHAPHMIHRHEDGTEEWMAFFTDNEGRPVGLMSQVVSAGDGQSTR